MFRSGDVKVYKKDSTLQRTKEFNAPIQVLDIRNEIKLDYSPIGFVRSGCTACRNSAFPWKMGKETGGTDSELRVRWKQDGFHRWRSRAAN